MSAVLPAHLSRDKTDDLTALAWVQDELRRSLELAHKSMRRHLKEAESLEGVDHEAVDPALLKQAQAQLHQGVGALELVGLPSAALVLRASEDALARLQRTHRLGGAAVDTLEFASFALLDYLQRLLAGKPVSPLLLFPQYRAVQELAGAERTHPADLWPVEWRWREIPSDPRAQPRPLDADARSAVEAQTLALMRQPDGQAAQRLSDLFAGLGAGTRHQHAATLWKLAAAFFEAQAQRLLRPDMHTKRIASRLMAQLRAGERQPDAQSTEVTQRLAHDLLFFCAQALEGADAVRTPRLVAVRSAWSLPTEPAQDYDSSRLGRFDPAWIAQARKRVANAREAWSAVAGGELLRLPGLVELFQLVGDSLKRLYPSGDELAAALHDAVSQTSDSGEPPPAGLAMEVATSVLYLDASLEDADFDQPGEAERVQRLAQRIAAARGEQPAQPLDAWMEALYRRVSDRQTMGSVVQEVRVALAESEKQIDLYFRNPAQRDLLVPVPGQLQAMRGVLSVLGLEQGSQTVLRMRDDVDALLHAPEDAAPDMAIFDRLAANLGMLGFLIDMLSVQPQVAKSLFAFDAETGLLRSQVGGGAAHRIAASAEPAWPAAEATRPAPLQGDAPSGFAATAIQPDEPFDLLLAGEPAPQPLAAELPGVVESTLPLPAVSPAPPAALPLADDDGELRDIFIEEARDVLQSACGALEGLDAHRDDIGRLTVLRRAFHTLKGSSRMVGLTEFGDAAWSAEQLYNARLASHSDADESLLGVTADVLSYLSDWVECIAVGRDGGHEPQAVQHATESLRLHGRRETLPLPSAAPSIDELPFDMATGPVPMIDAGGNSEYGALESSLTEPLGRTPPPVQPPQAPSALLAAVPDLPSADELDLDFGFELAPDLVPEPAYPMPPKTPPVEREFVDLQPLVTSPMPLLPLGDEDEGAPLPVVDFDLDAPLASRDGGDHEAPAAAADAGMLPLPEPDVSLLPEGWPPFGAGDAPAEAAVSEELPDLVLPDALGPLTAELAPEALAPAVPPAGQPLPEPLDFEFSLDGEPAPPADAAAFDVTSFSVPAVPDVPVAPIRTFPTPSPSSEPRPRPADDWLTLDFGDADAGGDVLPVEEAAAEYAPMAAAAADEFKQIGSLSVPLPLFNVFLAEADEQSRRLGIELAEWALELHRPVGEAAVALAHSLAGNSATVGFGELSQLARVLEHALAHADALGRGDSKTSRLFNEASDEIRALLHQFAAGFLKSPSADLLDRLHDGERHLAEQAAAAVAGEPVPDSRTGTLSGDLDEGPAEDAGNQPAAEAADEAIAGTADPAGYAATQFAAPRDFAGEGGDTHHGQETAEGALAGEDLPDAVPSFGPPEPPAMLLAKPPVLPAEAVPAEPADFEPTPSVFDQLQPPEIRPLAPAEAPTGPVARADAIDAEEGIDAVDAIDGELFPIFEEEAQELLPELAARLREWAQHPSDPAGASACMRTLHTLKGGARLAGAMRLGEMAHRLETTIEHVLSRGSAASAEIDALQGRVDALNAAFEGLQRGGQEAAPWAQASADDAAQAALAPMHPVPMAPGTPQPLPSEPSVPAPVDSYEPPAAEDAAPQPVAAPAAAVPATIDWLRFAAPATAPVPLPAPSVTAASQAPVRVRAALLDRLVNHAGEVSITRSRIDADLRTMKGSLGDLTENLERLRRQLRDLELQAETQISSRMEAAKAASETFDPLEMDRFTRFQELTRMMAESVNDVATVQRSLQRALQSAEDEVAAQTRLTRDLQDDLLRTRMVEFESIADRLYRVVRQASKETAKPVRLDIVGGAIEVDRGVLDRMTGAFEHLLRNCVVHGIEPAALRAERSKDATGRITVSVTHAGNEVGVEVRDDGGGLDLLGLRQRGVELGLLQPDSLASDAELAQLVFAPGLTTAREVTELAGRGVGMDVVRSEVVAMGGRIETATTWGQGTSFRLVLPLTTAVTQVVMLRAGGLTVAVPSPLVEAVRRAPSSEVVQSYASGRYLVGGEAGEQSLPFFWLGALLQDSLRGVGSDGEHGQSLVVIRSAQQRVVLHVDEVLGNQEVVVKHLGAQLSRLPGLVGVTLMASGLPTLIYNPVALATLYGDGAQAAGRDAGAGLPVESAPVAAPQQAPLVLVVDDSLTVRRVTQRLLQREGYRVELAKDGIDGLEKLAQERPAVLLTDIEMPRMDGFDLVRNVRAQAALQDLPVIMITSRIAQKHRDVASELGVDHYLGKPYSEEELLALVARYAGIGAAQAA